MNGLPKLRNIALIGFMGTGKSSVGRLAATQLGYQFLDTDEQIESQAGCTINELFQHQGEEAFRAMERQFLDTLSAYSHTVFSTGGGLAANLENLARLKAHAFVICLWASPEVIWDRVRYQQHRPLLKDPDPLAKVQRLLAEREPFYRQADLLLNTEQRSVKQVVQHVIHQYRLAQQQSLTG